MRTKKLIEVEGYKIEEPQSYPVSLKDFMRVVIGGTIAKARTETERTGFLRRFLNSFNERVKAGQIAGNWEHQGITLIPPSERIAEKKLSGLDEAEFYIWSRKFLLWRKDLLTNRARIAANAKWAKKKKAKKTLVSTRKRKSEPSKPHALT